MRTRLWLLGSLTLFVGLPAVACMRPWPTPPPQDPDEWLCSWPGQPFLGEMVDHLAAFPPTEEYLAGDGCILSARGRLWTEVDAEGNGQMTYALDFLFWLGPSEIPEYGRYRVVRVLRTEILPGGAAQYSTVGSPELVLAGSPAEPPSEYFAGTMAVLRACGVVLKDAHFRRLAASLLPYYSLEAVRTPRGVGYAPGEILPVTVHFQNQTNRNDRTQIVVEITGDNAGQPVVKSVRTR